MSIVPVDSPLSLEVLVNAAKQLSDPDLQKFSATLHAVRSQRHAPCLSADESELFQQINEPLPTELQRRFDELVSKRDACTLSVAEHDELLQLTERVEAANVARVAALTKLAAVRNVSLRELMKQLRIQISPDE